jgi:hypothetical protein
MYSLVYIQGCLMTQRNTKEPEPTGPLLLVRIKPGMEYLKIKDLFLLKNQL